MREFAFKILALGVLFTFVIFSTALAGEAEELEEEEIDKKLDHVDEEKLEVSDMDIEDLINFLEDREEEEEDIIGEEIEEIEEDERDRYDNVINLEEAKEMTLESNQARQTELALELMDIRVDIARDQYSDLEDEPDVEELREDRVQLRRDRERLERDMDILGIDFDVPDFSDIPIDMFLGGGMDGIEMDNVDGDMLFGQGSNPEGGEPDDIDPRVDPADVIMEVMINELQYQLVSEQIDAMMRDDTIDEMRAQAEEAKREAEQERDLAYLEWEEIGKKELQFATESMYVGLIVLDEQLNALEASYSSAKRMYEQEKARVEAGLSTGLVVDSIQLQKDEMKDAMESLENTKKEMERELKSFIDIPMDESVYLEPVSFNIESFEDGYNFQGALSYALEDGAEIELAKKEVEYAEDNLEWTENEHGDDSEEYEIKEIELEQAKMEKETTKEEIEKSAHENYNAFNDAMSDYRLAEEAMELQAQSSRADLVMFDVGMTTENDYKDSISELQESISRFEQAKLQGFLAKRELVHLDDTGIVLDAAVDGEMDMEDDDVGREGGAGPASEMNEEEREMDPGMGESPQPEMGPGFDMDFDLDMDSDMNMGSGF